MPVEDVWEHDVTIPMGGDGTMVDLLFRPHRPHIPFMASLDRNYFLRGDRGSAKSKHGIWKLHTLARKYPGFKYMVIRRQYAELEQSFLLDVPDDLERMGGEPLGYKYHNQKHRVEYPNGSRGFFRVCDTERDLRKVLGLEYHAALIDESPELPWQWIVKIGTSLRKPEELGIPIPPLMMLLGNLKGESIDEHYYYFRIPDEETGEIDADVLEEPEYDPADWTSMLVRLGDNPSLNQVEYRKRFVGLDAATRDAWLEGKRFKGPTLFSPTPAHRTATVSLGPETRVYRSLVVGLVETDPAVCLWIVKVGLRTVVLCERVWVGKTVTEMAADMRAVDALCQERQWPIARQSFVSSQWSLKKPDTFDAVAEFGRVGIGLTVLPEDLDQLTRRIHQALGTSLESGPALQIVVAEKGATVSCPKLWKALPKQLSEDNHPSRMKSRPDSGPVRALGLYLLSEASVAGGPPMQRRPEPAWWKYRPVSRVRRPA
jgi:hypothetical protein